MPFSRFLPQLLVLLASLASSASAAEKPPATQKSSPVQKPSPVQKLTEGEPTDCPRLRRARTQDELWVVSSRHLCWSDIESKSSAVAQLSYEHLVGDEWKRESLTEYVAAEQKTTCTVMFVHGFWTDYNVALQLGEDLFRVIVDEQTDPAPLRLVIWSWPSDRTRTLGIAQQARDKAWRSDLEGQLLAELLNASKTEHPVSLLGYSLGVRAISGAMHLIDGGTVDDRHVTATQIVRKIPIRAVSMAAAMHNHWLDEGQRFSRALNRVEHMTLLNNACDRVLRLYPRAFGGRRRGPAALGATGLYAEDLAPAVRGKFEQFDVASYVGKRHLIRDYIAWIDLVKKMQVGVFGNAAS